MTTALILMKAMPPTQGHKRMIKWAEALANNVVIIMDVAPDEPMTEQRAMALDKMSSDRTFVDVMEVFEQDPEAEGFWERWDEILSEYKGSVDYVVASEPYGQIVADKVGAKFMPYDPKREMHEAKAQTIRDIPDINFDWIAEEFQPYLKTVVTIFGAESTGKTTIAKDLTRYRPDHDFAFEWARPYLETVGPEITVDSMVAIWEGQRALQESAREWPGSQVLVQDTDLFSTVGYWAQPHWEKELGPVPERLIRDAISLKSDLYIITKSNIPFEEDPIRYGGDKRESPDEYWIALAQKYDLNYIVIDESHHLAREQIAGIHIHMAKHEKQSRIKYDRKGL